MSGAIDPLFENHPEIVAVRKSAEEFIDLLKHEQGRYVQGALLSEVLEEMHSLEGEELDAYLLELGLQPAELLALFDVWMEEK